MRWLPAKRQPTWWWIAGIIALVEFATIGLGVHLLLPFAQPKYFFIALFCLATGGIIGGMGWVGARWFPPFATLGLVIGLVVMLSSFTGNGGWEDLIGILSLLIFLVGGVALGAVVEIALWVHRTVKARRT